MNTIGRIAFIKSGDFSHINNSAISALRTEFPEAELDIIDVNTLRSRGRHNLPLYAASAFWTYGLRAARGREALKQYLHRTPAYLRAVRIELAGIIRDKGYAFTIQTQSLFDGSVTGIPHFVYTDHTHLANLYYPAFDRAKLLPRAWTRLEQSIYDNARTVFTMSTHVSRSLVEQYHCDPAKVECVQIGSNIEIPPERSLEPSRYARKEILFVGIDWKRKGGPQLLQAFRIVSRSHPDARLTIVGCSPSIDVPNCRVLGLLPLAEIGPLYRQASIFCLPTQIEPFGIAFLEAFAHRLPVVSTNVGALPDIVVDGVSGYLIDGPDIEVLAARLNDLLASPELCRQFGEAGFRRLQETYTWEATGRRIANRVRAELAASGR
ncbi:MAG: glycosyltransferase family 4 protein [Pseudomonadota bacterium]